MREDVVKENFVLLYQLLDEAPSTLHETFDIMIHASGSDDGQRLPTDNRAKHPEEHDSAPYDPG